MPAVSLISPCIAQQANKVWMSDRSVINPSSPNKTALLQNVCG
ncbi:hypothetical protein AB28_4994 [Raoultella ornithinolytica 2-156-04_S1_C2]|nr:hypothetical protein AB00_4772 [Raoultella ornithinolytica 2-156-04_S1_C1]KDX09895.1 hypothetical protein AB28_4994 [Raoultella ornithinolytica 2-156-04_S1_C2]